MNIMILQYHAYIYIIYIKVHFKLLTYCIFKYYIVIVYYDLLSYMTYMYWPL